MPWTKESPLCFLNHKFYTVLRIDSTSLNLNGTVVIFQEILATKEIVIYEFNEEKLSYY